MFDEIQTPEPTAVTAAPAAPAQLADVLALIAGDAEWQAPQYLEETVVPHGGE
jgi:hypothetical protein